MKTKKEVLKKKKAALQKNLSTGRRLSEPYEKVGTCEWNECLESSLNIDLSTGDTLEYKYWLDPAERREYCEEGLQDAFNSHGNARECVEIFQKTYAPGMSSFCHKTSDKVSHL